MPAAQTTTRETRFYTREELPHGTRFELERLLQPGETIVWGPESSGLPLTPFRASIRYPLAAAK